MLVGHHGQQPEHNQRRSKTNNVFFSGINLDRNILFYNVLDCKVYYRKEKRPSDCVFNITNLYCSSNPIALDRWPPRMETEKGDTSLLFGLSYRLFPYFINGSVASKLMQRYTVLVV